MDILAAPGPKNLTELRISLYLVGYYHRYMRNFKETPVVLHAVTSMMESFKITEEVQEAFEDLKKKQITPQVLGFTDFESPFAVETDA